MRPKLYMAGRALAGQSGHEAGRELLRQLYGAHVAGQMPEICVAPSGKPHFADSEWHFSISHTHRRVFCALSRENIGIDAEELDRNISLRLAQKILSPGERAQFDAAPDPRRALLTFWVLKEAAAKLSGEGLRGYPNDTNFRLDDRRVMEYDGCLLAVMTQE